MTKRTIPQIREEMFDLASELNALASRGRAVAARLSSLAVETTRRAPVRRAPNTSQRVTPAVRANIRALAQANPDMSIQEIATALGINPGRVSEVLAGKRG